MKTTRTNRLGWLAFISMMGALGNALFFLSTLFSVGQISIDASHLGTMVAAIFGGPLTGLIVGIIVGIGPGIWFGPLGGLGFLGFVGLPLGKGLTGFFLGLIADRIRIHGRNAKSLLTIGAVALGFVPESLFTIYFFQVLVKMYIPAMADFTLPILLAILPKSWLEIIILGGIMGALVSNKGVLSFFVKVMPWRAKQLNFYPITNATSAPKATSAPEADA